jgi:purine-cytosine permease-like protein
VVLLVLLVGESDQAFANINSSAVTIQNVVPRARQRALIVAVAMVAFVAAWFLSMDTYEFFLFLIGSVFVPLFGVFAAHYFVLRAGRFGEAGLFHPGREVAGGVNWRALAPWTAGFAVYQWCVPTGPAGWVEAVQTFYSDWLRLPFPLLGSRIGASAPAFAVAFALSLLLRRRIRQTRAPISRSPSVGAAEGQPP